MRVGDLALTLQLKPQRIVQVTHIRGRLILAAWFREGEDPKKKGAKLDQGQFWAHQLDFDADRVRAFAKKAGF